MRPTGMAAAFDCGLRHKPRGPLTFSLRGADPTPLQRVDSNCSSPASTHSSSTASTGWCVVGGTSASSPIVASVIRARRECGLRSPRPRSRTRTRPALNDVTSGHQLVIGMQPVLLWRPPVNRHDGSTRPPGPPPERDGGLLANWVFSPARRQRWRRAGRRSTLVPRAQR